MGDKGKKDKGNREEKKKAKLNPKEKRKLKKEKKKTNILSGSQGYSANLPGVSGRKRHCSVNPDYSSPTRYFPARWRRSVPSSDISATKGYQWIHTSGISQKKVMKIGQQTPSFTWPGGPEKPGLKMAEIASCADEAGFASLWVMDHFWQIDHVGPVENEMLES